MSNRQTISEYISIGENLRFYRCDEHNIVLEEFCKSDSGRGIPSVEKWRTVGYYSDIYQTINRVLSIKTADVISHSSDLKNLLTNIEAIKQEIKKEIQTAGLTVQNTPRSETSGRGRKSSVIVDVATVGNTDESESIGEVPAIRGRGRPRKEFTKA
jgi:hypothetical protein